MAVAGCWVYSPLQITSQLSHGGPSLSLFAPSHFCQVTAPSPSTTVAVGHCGFSQGPGVI